MTRLETERQKDKIFLFLDNLKVHHGKLVKEWLSEHLDHIQVFYFPSYAPELNPQEYLNNILKQNIHSGIAPKCKKQIYEKANQFLT
jgi:transposase